MNQTIFVQDGYICFLFLSRHAFTNSEIHFYSTSCSNSWSAWAADVAEQMLGRDTTHVRRCLLVDVLRRGPVSFCPLAAAFDQKTERDEKGYQSERDGQRNQYDVSELKTTSSTIEGLLLLRDNLAQASWAVARVRKQEGCVVSAIEERSRRITEVWNGKVARDKQRHHRVKQVVVAMRLGERENRKSMDRAAWIESSWSSLEIRPIIQHQEA